MNCLNHIHRDHNVTSLATVGTATSSDVPCQLHRDREENVSDSLGLWWSEDGALSSWGTCGRPPQHCTKIVRRIPLLALHHPPSCRWPADPLCSFSPGPARLNHRVLLLRMDPAVLIFLLYVMIAHELFCGWMHYRRQRNKSRKAAGPVLRSRFVCMCVRARARASVCATCYMLNTKTLLLEKWGHFFFVGKYRYFQDSRLFIAIAQLPGQRI